MSRTALVFAVGAWLIAGEATGGGCAMFITVMMTDPAGAPLDPAAADAVRNAWGGGALDWLAPGHAVEFALESMPENRWQVWQEMQALYIDLCIVPREGRRKRLLLADMDSTMIQQECIDELADVAGVGARVKDITARAMNGELDFEAALRERVGLLAGLDVGVIDQVFAERITLMPGGPALVTTMRAHGARAALVSGGFTAFTERVSAVLGFDLHRANRLIAAEGVLTGEVGLPILGREAKVAALEEVTADMGICATEVIAVGDGANDLGMLTRAGLGVALHAKPVVAAEVDQRVTFGDLTALLWLQGYRADDVIDPNKA